MGKNAWLGFILSDRFLNVRALLDSGAVVIVADSVGGPENWRSLPNNLNSPVKPRYRKQMPFVASRLLSLVVVAPAGPGYATSMVTRGAFQGEDAMEDKRLSTRKTSGESDLGRPVSVVAESRLRVSPRHSPFYCRFQ